MSGRKKSVNNEVALLRARIAEYRSTRWPRAPLPTALWAAAGRVARVLGVHLVGHPQASVPPP